MLPATYSIVYAPLWFVGFYHDEIASRCYLSRRAVTHQVGPSVPQGTVWKTARSEHNTGAGEGFVHSPDTGAGAGSVQVFKQMSWGDSVQTQELMYVALHKHGGVVRT